MSEIEQPKQRRPRFRRWLRGIGFVLLGVVGLVFSVVLFLHTDSGQALIKKRVHAALSERVNGTVELETVELKLFGQIAVGNLTLKDTAGNVVVHIESLRIQPGWRELVRGNIVLDRVQLSGVSVNLEQYADGTSNLKKLFKPRPPSAPSAPSKKKRRRIQVREIALDSIAFTLKKPDGSLLSVTNVAIQGSVDTVPDDKTLALSVPTIRATLSRTTPQGTNIRVDDISLGLDAKLVDGAGTVDLLPLSAKLTLERPGKKPYSTPIQLGGVSLDIEPGKLGAALSKLELGLLILESLEVEGAAENGALKGDQNALLVGLHLKGEEIDALVGKDLVDTDIDIAAKIGGPPEAMDVELDVKTNGGKIQIKGKVDASHLEQPKYVLTLTATDIVTKKILAGEAAPDVESGQLVLDVDGSGLQKEKIAADVKLAVGPTRIGKVHVDRVFLKGRLENGVVHLRELEIDALDQKIAADGTYVLAEKKLDAKLRISGDVGRALAKLRAAGVPIKTNLPPGAVRLVPGEMEVEVSGKLDEGLTVRLPNARLRVAGGTASVDATLALRRGGPNAEGKRSLTLDTIDADVRLSRVHLGSLAAIRGKKLDGFDGAIDGHVVVKGTKASPRLSATLRLKGKAEDSDEPIEAKVTAKGDRGTVDLDVAVERGGNTRIATLHAHLPIDPGRKALAPGRELTLKVDVPKQKLRDLAAVLPPKIREKLAKIPKETDLEAHVDIGGTSQAPTGTFHVVAETALMAPFFSTRQRVDIAGRIQPDGAGSKLETELGVWADTRKPQAITGNVEARFRRSPLVAGGAKELDWKLVLDIPRQRIEELPLPPRDLKGAFFAHIALAGNQNDVNGKLDVTLDDVYRGGTGPLGAHVLASIEPNDTRLEAKVTAAKLEALLVKGTVGVAGTGLIPRARKKELGDPSLEVDLTVPRRRLDAWAVLRPKLAEFEGAFGGKIAVRGSVQQPLVKGDLGLDGFDMLDERPGRANVALVANAENVAASVTLGHASEPPRLRIDATADRDSMLGLLRSKEGDAQSEVAIAIRGDAKLPELVPKIKKGFPDFGARGDVDWNMDGKLVLESHDGQRSLGDAWLVGALTLAHGKLPIPTSGRHYDNVELGITATKEALSIDKLTARESDREKKSRRLDAHGKIAWRRLKPQNVQLELETRDWLLFGSDTLGKPDAPRASLSAKLAVNGRLTEVSRDIRVEVKSLDLNMPDRFEKAHWPEAISLGDIIYLDQKGTAVGKLPRPERAPPPAPADPNAIDTKVVVEIPNRVHIQKPPFDMHATGKIAIQISQGQRTIQGEVVVHDGGMELGGNVHEVSKKHKSRILFDAAHPKGELDLYLETLPTRVAALRDVSKASAGGDEIRIHLTGGIAKPVSTVTGVGNADLWDILPVHNAGRVKFTSQPDMPPSASPQLPREYDVVLISYMAVNLPHNLFLSRMNAWSDEYDDRFAYGKVRHMEAERYSKSGKTRVRVAERPPTIGQSNGEIEADYMLLNQPRTKAGVGVVGGTRAGGGPALFFEWQSDD